MSNDPTPGMGPSPPFLAPVGDPAKCDVASLEAPADICPVADNRPRAGSHMSQSKRYAILAAVVALVVAAPAQALGSAGVGSAASKSKRCRALAPKARVVVRGPDSLVFVRGKRDNFTQTFYACLYAKPRLYKIPGQNGGDTERFARFTLSGRYVAYEHVNVEEASNFYPGYIELVDVRKRKRIFQHDAFPLTIDEENAGAVTGLTQILLREDGAVAWIGREENSKRYSVQTALRTQKNPAEVDRGRDVGPHSLRRGVDEAGGFSWTRGGERKTAPFGGPAPAR
jgi:hypothetical protein